MLLQFLSAAWTRLRTGQWPVSVPSAIASQLSELAASVAAPGTLIVNVGSKCMCDKGLSPCTVAMGLPTVITATAQSLNALNGTPAVLPTFGNCTSQANPTVFAATQANKGVLTPMPCAPKLISPWSEPSTTVNLSNAPAVTAKSTLKCAYGGTIMVQGTSNQKVKAG
jgi:hypothetical protein